MITVDGTLYITHVSREPLRSLVEDALAILRDACAVSSVTKDGRDFCRRNIADSR
jgi:hypothetical protein